MAALTLHPMKEIRVIVSGEHRPFVTELLDKVEANGYTIIGNISGKGQSLRARDVEKLLRLLKEVDRLKARRR